MAQLTFSGRSLDGAQLLLKDESGQTYTLAIDARLRSALRTKPDRNGQLEIQMESALRPRDIQARIRAGETPEAVAHAAGTSVEKIMPYAAPVLAERAHVAQRAQLSSVRRRTADSGARTLGEAVEAQLRAHNVDPGGVEWDAWRREDGRWTLTAAFASAPRSGTATYSFDMRGNFVTLDDEDAHWLVGDLPAVADAPDTAPAESPADSPADDLAAARQRRLNAVPADELPLGADAIEMVTEGAPAEPPVTTEPSASETTLELGLDEDLGAEQPVESFLDPAPPGTSAATTDVPATDLPATGQPKQSAEEEPAPRKASKRRGRASVPSWDEIMFGGGKGD